MANTKTIVKNTGFLYFRMVVTMLIGLFSVRIVLKALGEVDYGIYNVVAGIVTMLAFLNNSLSSTTQRFLSYELGNDDKKRLNEIFSTSFILYLFFSLVIIVLAETIGLWFVNSRLNIPSDRMVAANWVYQFTVFSFVFSVLQAPYNALVISHEKMNVFAFICVIEAIIKLGLVFLLLYSGQDRLILYGLMMCLMSLFVLVVYILYCKKLFSESTIVWKFNTVLMKELGGFAGWNTVGAISNVFKNQGVNIVLNVFFGPVVNAARGIAYQVDGALNSVVQNIYSAVRPNMTKLYAASEQQSLQRILYVSTVLGYLMMLVMTVFFVLETRVILDLWLDSTSEYMVTFTRLVLISLLSNAIHTPFSYLISASGRIKGFQLVSSIINIAVLPISFLLCKSYGDPVKCFYAIIVASCFHLINVVYFSHKEGGVTLKWFFQLFGRIVISSILICVPAVLIKFIIHETLLRWLALFIFLMTSSTGSFYYLCLSPNDRILVKDWLKSVLNAKHNGGN